MREMAQLQIILSSWIDSWTTRVRDRVVASCLLAVRGVSKVRVEDELSCLGMFDDLRSGTSLTALSLEAARPLLSPLSSHLKNDC